MSKVRDVSETSFTKLFSSITNSTIWAEDDQTRLVWITMLALADQNGYVGASLPGLAHQARVSIEAATKAIEKFLAPDTYSRSPEFEGRRIEPADRGWTLLNYQRFREMRDEEVRKEYERKRKASQRKRTREQQLLETGQIGPGQSAKVRDSPPVSPGVPPCLPVSAQAEAEAEAEAEEINNRVPSGTRAVPPVGDGKPKAADQRRRRAREVHAAYEDYRVEQLHGARGKVGGFSDAVHRRMVALLRHVEQSEQCDESTAWDRILEYGRAAVDEAARAVAGGGEKAALLVKWRRGAEAWRPTRYDAVVGEQEAREVTAPTLRSAGDSWEV
jgi:hypothetical protein